MDVCNFFMCVPGFPVCRIHNQVSSNFWRNEMNEPEPFLSYTACSTRSKINQEESMSIADDYIYLFFYVITKI